MNGKEESRVNTLWPFRFDDQLADWLQVHTPGCSIVARLTATTHATSRYGNEPGIVGGRESSFFKVFSHLSLLLSSPPPLPPSIFFQEFGKRRGGCRPFYLFLCIWRSCFRFFFFFDIFSSSLFLFYHVLFFWRGEGGVGGALLKRFRGLEAPPAVLAFSVGSAPSDSYRFSVFFCFLTVDSLAKKV